MPGKERKILGQINLYYCLVFLIYALDQLSKIYAERFLVQGCSVPVIENIFHLTFINNTGAAFGMLRAYPYLFVVISVFSIILISYFLIQKKKILTAMERTGFCFILGGTLGNLTDRIRVGYVIDFIDLRVWPVFNMADSFITVGAVILGLSIILHRKHLK